MIYRTTMTIIAFAALILISVTTVLASSIPPRDDSYLDGAASMIATNAVCDAQLVTADRIWFEVQLAAGQLGLAPEDIRDVLKARAAWMTATLYNEMPTARERAVWCAEIRAIMRRGTH